MDMNKLDLSMDMVPVDMIVMNMDIPFMDMDMPIKVLNITKRRDQQPQGIPMDISPLAMVIHMDAILQLMVIPYGNKPSAYGNTYGSHIYTYGNSYGNKPSTYGNTYGSYPSTNGNSYGNKPSTYGNSYGSYPYGNSYGYLPTMVIMHMDPFLLPMITPTDIKPLNMQPLLDTPLVPLDPLMAPMEVLTLLLDIDINCM